MDPLLSGQRAVIHGGAGALGSAIARTFVREGAAVVLTGRTRSRLEAVAVELRAAGGRAEVMQLDVLDEAQVDAHVAEVGAFDIMVNAIGVAHVQGVEIRDLELADFMRPIDTYVRSTFFAARVAGRVMARQGRGVIFTLSAPSARLVGRGWLGQGVAFAAVETMTRLLAAELGPAGVRAICLCSDALPEALARGSHTRVVFGGAVAAAGITIDEMLASRAQSATLLGRLPTLAQIADTAAFLASPRAAAITGTVANLTCGSLTT